MTAVLVIGAVWLAASTAVAVVIGRSIRLADRREVDAAMNRHPAGKAERHLRVVKAW